MPKLMKFVPKFLCWSSPVPKFTRAEVWFPDIYPWFRDFCVNSTQNHTSVSLWKRSYLAMIWSKIQITINFDPWVLSKIQIKVFIFYLRIFTKTNVTCNHSFESWKRFSCSIREKSVLEILISRWKVLFIISSIQRDT